MDDRNRRSVSRYTDAGRVRDSQWSAEGRHCKEEKVWHQGRIPGVHHTAWSRVMKRKVQLARAVASLTGRIETFVVLISRSGRTSPVDAEEYHDRLYRRPLAVLLVTVLIFRPQKDEWLSWLQEMWVNNLLKVIMLQKVVVLGSEPVTYRSRNRHADHSAIVPHSLTVHKCPCRLCRHCVLLCCDNLKNCSLLIFSFAKSILYVYHISSGSSPFYWLYSKSL